MMANRRSVLTAAPLRSWSAGQIQGLIHDVPTVKELVERIVAEAEEIINARLAAMTQRFAQAAE